jgi:hypothetical protein
MFDITVVMLADFGDKCRGEVSSSNLNLGKGRFDAVIRGKIDKRLMGHWAGKHSPYK